MTRAIFILALGAAVLAGCARDRAPDLITPAANTSGPDEFAILPGKPLEDPSSYAALPPPTPGGRNLADPQPQADAVAALGGNPAVLTRGATDGGLLSYAGRYGTNPEIRPTLAAEDLAFRQRNRGRVLERLFNLTVYYDSYEPFSLNKHRELERFRAAGIPTPAAPPPPSDE